MGRPAFTLIELMIATAITCIISAGVMAFFSGSKRLSREGYVEVSTSISNRIAREKRFFVDVRTEVLVNPPITDALNSAIKTAREEDE